MTHEDIEAENRIATIEHLLAVVLANMTTKPSDLVSKLPPAFTMDRDVITRADAMWHTVTGL